MLRACALVLLCGVPVASPALVSPVVACTWLLPCETPGSGAVGRGLQPEDAVVVFARSCGSVCNKPPTHQNGQRARTAGCDARARCALLAYIDLCRLSAVLQGSSVVGSTQAQDLLAEAEELRAAGESKRSKAGY